jgi:hypothetical protein
MLFIICMLKRKSCGSCCLVKGSGCFGGGVLRERRQLKFEKERS